MRLSLFFVSFFITLCLVSCQSSRKGKDKPAGTTSTSAMHIDQISFRFRDSSVPPPYHRSYTIDITPESAHYAISDYSDVLKESTKEVSSEDWERLVQMTDDLQKPGSYQADGASGTTGKTITLRKGQEEVYSLYWDSLSDDKIKPAALELVKEIKRVSNYSGILSK